MSRHIPVLHKEVIEYLDPQSGQNVIDGTIGDGGHAELIIEKIGDGKLLGLDQDPESLKRTEKFLGKKKNIILKQGNFRELKSLIPDDFGDVHGILFDLGWSSPQFSDRNRGFSFQNDEPLDMRMDPSQTLTAADIVNNYYEDELGRIIRTYGEDRRWRSIAQSIVKARKEMKIETTLQLVDIIGGNRRGSIHPATRTFQALRIAVTDELEAFKDGLADAFEVLAPGGRIMVISFHSGEDRIVKQMFKKDERLDVVTKRPITAQDDEIKENPRSRSAKLRVAVKTVIPAKAGNQ